MYFFSTLASKCTYLSRDYTMSVRAVWVFLAPKKARSEESSKVLFSRRFPLAEKRQKQFASKHECEHCPIPTDKDVLTSVSKQACSDETKVMLCLAHVESALEVQPYSLCLDSCVRGGGGVI